MAVAVFVSIAVSIVAQNGLESGMERPFYTLEDFGKELSIAQVQSRKSAGEFVLVTDTRIKAKESGSALWLNFALPAADDEQQTRVLVIGPGYLDEATLYRGTESGPAEFDPMLSGDAIPFTQKPYPHRLHVFPLSSDAGEYYLRATSEGILRINWEIKAESSFRLEDKQQAVGYAILFGFLVCMMLYNLGIYISTGDSAYIYYVSYHFCAAMLIFSLSGYTSQLLWPGYANTTNTSVPLALTGMSLSGLLFVYSFLEFGRLLPSHAKIVRGIFLLVCLLAIPGLLLPYSEGMSYTYSGCLIVLAVIGYAVFVALKEDSAAARLMTITFFSTILPGSLGALGYELGLLPENFFFVHLFEITTAAETLLLSLFLSYRITLAETEMKQAQEKNAALQATFTQRVLARQEEDRNHIARELHDSVGQSLSLLHIHLCSSGRAAADESTSLLSDEQALVLLKQTITDVRQLSHSLHPSHLDRISLISAIGEFTRQLRGDGLPVFKMLMEVEETEIPEKKKIHLYRIVQEAVHNVISHADASYCHLSLQHVSQGIQLSIRDNGRGFSNRDRENWGLGLTSMTDRANAINATLEIDTQPGEGTRISVRFRVESDHD
ncbi:hypothetical protein C0039_18575 [Pseudohalioglobus lutimaris]|uniref:histidine kinase n=2 Tax=Pseudohalioglobus lutimaris TaxID=1737061 RepID=A0A2N5WY04_9GAMM|nr:hypothetical protein C0039_18575 [Pseudohalioglobus lutimaris]